MAVIAVVASMLGPSQGIPVVTPESISAAIPKQGCQTKACERRVRKQRRIHRRYPYCNTWRCTRRADRREARRRVTQWRRVVAPYRGWLDSTIACESPDGRDSASGTYHGYLQFDMQSWGAVGGVGDPHMASRLEQEYRGVLWLKEAGPGAWPVCGH